MTDYLFAMPTFISGMGAVLDLGGTMARFNEAFSPYEADTLAIANDWAMVGQDMRATISQGINARVGV